jgi:hypothetical protein
MDLLAAHVRKLDMHNAHVGYVLPDSSSSFEQSSSPHSMKVGLQIPRVHAYMCWALSPARAGAAAAVRSRSELRICWRQVVAGGGWPGGQCGVIAAASAAAQA